MPHDEIRALAGECTISFEDGRDPSQEERGQVLVIEKPDGTVLVHDRTGYRPVAWLTRAGSVVWDRAGDAPALTAMDGDRRLQVTCHEEAGRGQFPITDAGAAVGTCPDCGAALVRVPGAVTCLGCGDRFGIPRDAEVLPDPCSSCGLPTMATARGETFEVCIDRGCESLDDAVKAAFDRAWTCPECGGDLRIIRRGGLLAGCEGYPDCEAAFAIPAGTLAGDCPDCGLPTFETAGGRRCLDAGCAGG